MENQDAQVEYVLLSGSPETDEGIDNICDTLRHSLRTQFSVCSRVSIAIEGIVDFEDTPDGIQASEQYLQSMKN